jgi:mRNA interferase MazF
MGLLGGRDRGHLGSPLTQRGDIVIVALQGDSGKPRPAVVVQADVFDDLPTVVVLPLSSTLQEDSLTRITVPPASENGLRASSQINVDRPHTVRRTKLGPTVGRLDSQSLIALNRALAVFLGMV